MPFRIATALLTLLLPSLLAAAGTTPAVRSEIDALLSALGRADCRFQRNGSWHSAAEAQTHLQRKLAHIDKRGGVTSSEAFIELAATRSSLSGQAYQVRCGDAPATPSAEWLRTELARLRAASP